MIAENLPTAQLLVAWCTLVVWSVMLGVYRTLVDRIRSGLAATPKSGHRINKLLTDCLGLPNHERPFHIEASTLSSLQVFFGFLVFSKQSEFFSHAWVNPAFFFALCFLCALALERISSWLVPKRISQTSKIETQLRIALIPVLLIRILAKPLSLLMRFLEKVFQSPTQKIISEQEEGSEVADHIRIVGREGTNLDPDILQIMGNTIEMSLLKVNDVMIPRNQVQILDVNDPFVTNLEIAKNCGHTRLPLCENDLDKCLGIIHVKYAFRSFSDKSNSVDLRKITKAPAQLSREEALPVALKRMMKLKVHMALVKDEFGGIDGVITLEDILEEVVGEIQDEFDADEKPIEKIGKNKWRVSGLSPVHEFPERISLFEQEDDTATIGGVITGELGRIPENGELLQLPGLNVLVLDADDTRVLSLEIEMANTTEGITSEETE